MGETRVEKQWEAGEGRRRKKEGIDIHPTWGEVPSNLSAAVAPMIKCWVDCRPKLTELTEMAVSWEGTETTRGPDAVVNNRLNQTPRCWLAGADGAGGRSWVVAKPRRSLAAHQPVRRLYTLALIAHKHRQRMRFSAAKNVGFWQNF